MSAFLFVWELGGGSGHYKPAYPILRLLKDQGHDVKLIGKRPPPGNVGDFSYHPTPAIPKTPTPVRVQTTYADVLWNNGLSQDEIAGGVIDQWRRIYGHLRPHGVIGDHSPMALLVARSMGIPTVALGTGFCCPPMETPFPSFRESTPVSASTREREQEMLERVCRLVSVEPLNTANRSLATLLFDESTRFLCTYPELDHYPSRASSEVYWGTWTISHQQEAAPDWPPATTKYRAFAYLKPHPHLFELLCVLVSRDVSLLVYSPGVDSTMRQRLSLQGRVRFVDHPVDMGGAVQAADFVVLNSGHGSTATALLNGTPILQFPTNMEQVITTRNTVRIGAAVGVDAARPLTFNESVNAFLAQLDYCRAQAVAFAERQPDCAQNYVEIADRVQRLLAARSE